MILGGIVIKTTSPIKFVTPSDLPRYANIGIGGVAGAGKTHMLGTVGAGTKVLVFDLEDGTTTFRSRSYIDDPNATDQVHVVQFGDLTKTTELVGRLESAFDHLIRTKNSDGYVLVALDSLTELMARFLSQDQAADKRKAYGNFQEAVYALIGKARQIPAHTVFTARLRLVHEEVLNREIVRFDLNPAAWSSVSGLFDNIGFMDVRTQGVTSKRTLTFGHSVRYQGKDRMGIGDLVNPTFVEIMARMSGDSAQEKPKAAPKTGTRPAARVAAK